MPQADFTYEIASDAAGLPASISIFSTSLHVCDAIAEDLDAVGFGVAFRGTLAELIEGQVVNLGDAVILDCQEVDAANMAALLRLDMRLARSGAPLIVTTSLDALDDVFACFDQTSPQILVEPSRAERIVAIGHTVGKIAGARVREMSREDKLALLRLSEQVDSIARQIEGLSRKADGDGSGSDRLGEFKARFKGSDEAQVSSRYGHGRPLKPLDPALIRQVIARRQARTRFFDRELFADPAWDMLLDLAAAHGENQRVSVTSLCIASGVPATTALRWIRQMTDSGLFERVEDESDRRRVFIQLSEKALEAMMGYFAEVETLAISLPSSRREISG